MFKSAASTLADTTTIGVGCSAITRRVISRPFIPGKRISNEITSGTTRGRMPELPRRFPRRPPPPSADPRPIKVRRNSRTTRESSTIMTRALRLAVCRAAHDLRCMIP